MTLSNYKRFKALEAFLESLRKKSHPHAVRDALNTTAFEASDYLKKRGLKEHFTLKNSFTQRNTRYNKAKGRHINRMVSEVGSTLDYMADQNKGFKRKSRGKHGVPVPTANAANQGRLRGRTKPIRKPNQLSSIHLIKSGLGRYANEAQKRVVETRVALQRKKRIIFGSFGGTIGFWKIKGGRLGRQNRGWPKGARPHLLYSSTRKSIRVRKNQYLEDVTKRGIRRFPRVYQRAFERQMQQKFERHGISVKS